MRKISEELKSHLKKAVTTTANCWLIKCKDGSQVGLTDHSEDIIYNNTKYYSNNIIASSAIETSLSLSADNYELEIALNASYINESDLLEAKYDKASIEFFIVNYLDLSQGTILIRAGYIYEVRLGNGKFTVEIRSLSQELNKQTRAIYSETCRAQFQDSRCGANNSNHILYGVIQNVISNDKIGTDIVIQNPDLYRNAKIKFFTNHTSDSTQKTDETGVTKTLSVSRNIISLLKSHMIKPEKNCKFLLYHSCNKKFTTCHKMFNNALNFRGEPHVPGIDEMNKTVGTFK